MSSVRLADCYLEWARKELLREELDIDPSADYLLYADDLGLMKAIVHSTDSLIGLYRDDVKLVEVIVAALPPGISNIDRRGS